MYDEKHIFTFIRTLLRSTNEYIYDLRKKIATDSSLLTA